MQDNHHTAYRCNYTIDIYLFLIFPSKAIHHGTFLSLIRMKEVFLGDPSAQRLQYPLIKEYTLHYSRIPKMI